MTSRSAGGGIGGVASFVSGFFVGLADLIPGVSGGTMAYLLGIYPRLLRAVASVVPSRPLGEWLRGIDARFLLPFAAGGLLAVFSLTRVVNFPRALEENPMPWQALFSGIIAGVIVVFLWSSRRFKRLDGILFAVGFIGGIFLLLQVKAQLPHTELVLLAAGFAAAGAMLVPGVSGSYLLFVLGLYEVVLSALGNVHFPVLLPFLSGVALGLAFFACLLNSLLLRYGQLALMAINGILLASLFRLWPLSGLGLVPSLVAIEVQEAATGPLAWAMLLAGFAGALAMHRYASRSGPPG